MLFKIFIKKVLKHVDCIIVRGEKQKQQLHDIYRGRIECVFVPSEGPLPEAQKKSYEFKGKKQINVLFLGLVSQAKGAYDLLRAIPELIEKDDRFRFHFVGDIISVERNILFIKNEPFNLKSFIRKNNLKKYVRFYGRVEGSGKDRLYKDADLFVFPSYSEGSPFAVIEAMEYGLPVIVTPVGNLPELFENERNVLYVDFSSPNQIKNAVLRLKEDSEQCEEMVKNNFRILENQLSIKAYEKKMIDIFQNVGSR